jgi:putative FmdB family regulatory protein
MPIYEFRCRTCGQQFEVLVRGPGAPACPACAATALDKLVAAVAPPGKSAAIKARARALARREGHLSNE